MTKRRRKPNNKSMASRITNLEDAIHTLKELLDPTETKIMFLGPDQSEPDPDELDKGTVIIRFVGEHNFKELDPDEKQAMREEVEARVAERKAEQEAEAQAEIVLAPPPEAAEAAPTRKQDTVIEVAQGVRWGFQPSLQHRHRNYDTRSEWHKLNRSGII